MAIRKRIGEAKIGSAEFEAKRILEEGRKGAETAKKEALIEAKEEIIRQRNEAERELKERRNELTRNERRITQKEENIDKKADALEHKNEILEKKIKDAELVQEQVQAVLSQQIKRLEDISGYSVETAKAELLERAESEIKHELAQRLDEVGGKYLFVTESPIEKDLADSVIAQTQSKNAIVIALDSMQSITRSDIDGGASYTSVMDKNVSVLEKIFKVTED
jgi:ribonuclease Y